MKNPLNRRIKRLFIIFVVMLLNMYFEGVYAQDLITINAPAELQSALPDYSVNWSLPVQGNVVAIRSLNDVPFLYAVTDDSTVIRLLKISLSGKLIWEREWTKFKPEYYLNNLQVSEVGNLICLNRVDGWDENSQTKVFNGEGDETFHSTRGHGFYYPSPGGNFLSYQESNNYSPLQIYTISGKLLSLNSIPQNIGSETINRFIGSDQLLVYDNRKKASFHLLHVPDGKLEWSYRLDNSPWFIDLSNRNTAYNQSYLAIQGTTNSIITLLDMKGTLQWRSKEYESNESLDFSTDNNYLLAAVWSKDVVLLQLDSGKEEFYIRVSDRTNFGFSVDMDYHDHVLFVGGADTPYSPGNFLGTQRASYVVQIEDSKVQRRYIYTGAIETLYNSKDKTYSVFTALQGTNSIERRIKHESK